jgi:hypothetical protein
LTLSLVFLFECSIPNPQEGFQARNLNWAFKAAGESTEREKRSSQGDERDRYRVVQSRDGGRGDHRYANHHKAHRRVAL